MLRSRQQSVRELAAQQDVLARLIHIEEKADGAAARADEALVRLVNIEQKVDDLAERAHEICARLDRAEQRAGRHAPDTAEAGAFAGHPDQAFGHITYAQFGEDLIVADIFARLGVSHPSYLDVGAHHPFNVSNTALLHRRGSRGVNVEANPSLADAFRQHRPEDVTLNVGAGPAPGELEFFFIDDFSGRNTFDRQSAEEFVASCREFSIRRTARIEIVTLDQIVRDHCGGTWPDFLSIDAEGLDYAILESAHFGEGLPMVICAEAVSGADTDRSGSLAALLHARGYEVVFRTSGNVIFVHSSVARALAA